MCLKIIVLIDGHLARVSSPTHDVFVWAACLVHGPFCDSRIWSVTEAMDPESPTGFSSEFGPCGPNFRWSVDQILFQERSIAAHQVAIENGEVDPDSVIPVLDFATKFTEKWSCRCRPDHNSCHEDLINPATNRPYKPIVDENGYWQHPVGYILSCRSCGAHYKGDITSGAASELRHRTGIELKLPVTNAARQYRAAVRTEMGAPSAKTQAFLSPYVITQEDPKNVVPDVEALLTLDEYDLLPAKEKVIADRMTAEEFEGIHVVLLTPVNQDKTAELAGSHTGLRTRDLERLPHEAGGAKVPPISDGPTRD